MPPLSEQKQDDGRVLTVRELMAQHRANPVCASCHATIDPAGFALEQFDATGKWREVDVGFQPIDASGTMPNGTPFGGIHDFRDILVKNPDRFVHTVTRQVADVCDRSWHGVLRRSGDPSDRARGDGEQLPILAAGDSDCEQCAVPDASGGGRGDPSCVRCSVN